MQWGSHSVGVRVTPCWLLFVGGGGSRERQVESQRAMLVCLQAQVRALRAKVADYKRNTRIMNLETAQKQAQKATAAAQRYQQEVQRLSGELRRVKVVASERQKKMKAMRVEYNKLFRAVQEAQKEKQLPYQTRGYVSVVPAFVGLVCVMRLCVRGGGGGGGVRSASKSHASTHGMVLVLLGLNCGAHAARHTKKPTRTRTMPRTTRNW